MLLSNDEIYLASALPIKHNDIVGTSAVMKTLDCQIATAARSDLPVLITGESGTGKELVARAIHKSSDRSKKPFITFNCGALTESLLESELFGYERGAFTGANQTRKGLFEAARNGTIFLDEIGEMSTTCQVKLLRVLQEGAIRPIGGHSETPVNVRVIAATNRNLSQRIPSGKFREDLYYRIAVLTIDIPPLRKRPSDIPLLVQHFQRQAEEKTRSSRPLKTDIDAMNVLVGYAWPGNVRQLRHVVEKLVATTLDGETITADAARQAIPSNGLSNPSAQVPVLVYENDSLDDFLDRTLR